MRSMPALRMHMRYPHEACAHRYDLATRPYAYEATVWRKNDAHAGCAQPDTTPAGCATREHLLGTWQQWQFPAAWAALTDLRSNPGMRAALVCRPIRQGSRKARARPAGRIVRAVHQGNVQVSVVLLAPGALHGPHVTQASVCAMWASAAVAAVHGSARYQPGHMCPHQCVALMAEAVISP